MLIQKDESAMVVSKKNINAYPNPVEDILHVKLPFNAKNLSVKIINLNGVEVLRKNFSNGTWNIDLDVSKLSRGFYMLTIENETIKNSMSLIKR